jgi:hypothetical protein
MLAGPSRVNKLSPLNSHQIISCTLYRPGCTVYNVPSVEGQNHSFNRPEHSEHSIPIISRTIHSYSGRDYFFFYTARPFIHIQTIYGHSFLPVQERKTNHSFLYNSSIPSQVRRIYSYTDQDHSFLYKPKPFIPIQTRKTD